DPAARRTGARTRRRDGRGRHQRRQHRGRGGGHRRARIPCFRQTPAAGRCAASTRAGRHDPRRMAQRRAGNPRDDAGIAIARIGRTEGVRTMNPMQGNHGSGASSDAHATSNRVAMAVMSTIFFMWGFITVLNDVLIPHLKSLFTLNYAQVMLVQFTFFGAYFVMSLPSGKVVAHFGYRTSIITGLIVTGIGALLFIPAARGQSYPLFLTAFFVLASGITLLQVAANPYVSLLGPPQLASSRLNLVQALNSLGTTIGPKLGGLLILSSAVLGASELAKLAPAAQDAYRLQQAQMVQWPYIGIAVLLFVLAVVVWLFHMPRLQGEGADDAQHRFADALAHRRVWFGMAAIFVYVGAEVSIGSFMINYLSLPQIGDMTPARAAGYVSLYWGGAMIGRFVGSALLTRVDTRPLLALFAAVAGALVLSTMLTSGH